MTVGLLAANEPILRLMNTPEELMPDVKGYMTVIYAGLIVTAAYNSLAAVLRALGNSKSPLYFLIISAVINIFLDIVFITWFHMGVTGCRLCNSDRAGNLSAAVFFVYQKEIFDSASEKRGFPYFLEQYKKTSGAGNTDGPAVFHHRDWNDHCTGCG